MSGEPSEPLTPEQRRKFLAAAERGLRPRRAILRLAAHATGHMRHPHGDWCETCKEKYPCQAVRRAASPALDAVADLSPDPTTEPREPTERDVEGLVNLLASIRAGRDGNLQPEAYYRRWAEVDADTLLASDWYADRIAEARQAGAIAVTERVETEIAANDFPEAAAGRVRYALRGDTP